MPVDDRDDASSQSKPETEKETLTEALSSETDEPLPPVAERVAERDADRPEPVTPQGRRRRYLTRRNAFIATIAVAVGAVALVLVAIIVYRLGYIDRYIAGQIKTTFAEYGIRAEIKEFHTKFGPRTVEMTGIELYDSQTGEQLGKIDRLLATVRVTDLYALNLRRNVNLESLQVDGAELWVKFDAQGNSNFRNIKLPEPDPNRRILFSYSTAKVIINNALIHYGDEQHRLSGEARNIVATIQPDDPQAPAESWMNTVTLALSNSTFVYDGRPVNDISVEAHGRVNQTRAEIQELVLRSPVAEAHLQGTMDDWRNLRYQMRITSMIDLTQASDILQSGTALRGVGNLEGTVSGEGSRYQVDGEVKADALAADGVRLQNLNLTAKGTGDGASYDINGRAVAEVLAAGDFQLNTLQLAGGLMGTGTDFRWVGELRAAAARGAGTTLAGLILKDVVAESRDNLLTASASSASANRLQTSGASINGAQASDVRVRSENDVTTASLGSVRAGTVDASGVRVNGVTAGGVEIVNRDGATAVVANNVRVGGINAQGGARIGSLNIAGVRLTIRDGRVEGSSGDINAGTVALQDGHVENVRLARPVFVIEPQGRYRASADLSLGGGVLGKINLGAARSNVVATNDQIRLNNFTADVLNGNASGNATISTARNGASHVTADFNNLDIDNLLATFSQRIVPLTGKTSGTIDLAFPGSNIKAASGTVRAEFNGDVAGNEASDSRTALNGDVTLSATRGLFNIERANLRTASSELSATGRFSFIRSESDLQLNVKSSDATELQNVLLASGLFPDLDQQLRESGIRLGGNFAFNGNVRGDLTNPTIDGHAALDSLLVQDRDLGSVAANLSVTPDEIRLSDGRLTERDGGGAQFSLLAPRVGDNNIALDLTLDRANAGNLLAAVAALRPRMGGEANQGALDRLGDVQSDLSGRINVTGLPGAMSGNAELSFSPGRIAGEPFESIIARATFNGSAINLENVDARFSAGRITASGTYNTTTQGFDIQARGEGIKLDRLESFAKNTSGLPQLTGTADLVAHATGVFTDFSTYQINIDGEGRDVTVNGRTTGRLTLVGRTENKQFDLRLTTDLLGQPQTIAARVDLGSERLATNIETTLAGADLTPLFALLLPQSNVKVIGHATGTLKASGNLITPNEKDEDVFSLAGLRGTANFTDLTIQVEDIPLQAVSPLQVQFSSEEVFFEKTQFTGPGTNILFGGTAALGPGGRQSLTIDGKLNLRVLNGLSPNIFLSGIAEASVRMTGTYEQPRLFGTANVAGASIATLIGDERLTVSNVNGRVRFNSNQAQIDTLTGNLGGGRVVVSGGALLAGFTPTSYRFSVHGDDVTVPYPQGFRTTADADLEINGATRGQFITGVVNLRRAEYTEDIELADIINRRREASLTEGTGGDSAFAATTQLDVRVEGRDALVVRNNLADIVGSLSVRAVGPVEDPIISGRISLTRGTLNFRNDAYEVTRGFIDLPPARDADPILNIQAESEIKGYQVLVGLTGPLSQLTTTVRSDPALPQTDVVSLILTGNLEGGDTGTSTLAQTGLGTATSLLTDTLINAPVRRATDKLFGLNRFEIDPLIAGRGGASPTARLTVGRQINKDLSITYSTNLTSDQNQVLALEYRVSNRLSFVAQYEQGSVNGFSSRNDNFSFEIRFRKRF
ncbi:MAG TPA: translocation/assembly module TamB domain-containing protein [Pyrinomonadaceae bacterium]|jgi:translocation and assembly module TamB